MTILRRALAECIGTAFLLAAIVGSGIMGERLSSGNAAIALLANSMATGAALVVLILAFSPISGAHFNPAVTVAAVLQGRMPWRDVPSYVFMQIIGAFTGESQGELRFRRCLQKRARSSFPIYPTLRELGWISVYASVAPDGTTTSARPRAITTGANCTVCGALRKLRRECCVRVRSQRLCPRTSL